MTQLTVGPEGLRGALVYFDVSPEQKIISGDNDEQYLVLLHMLSLMHRLQGT